MHLLNRTVMVVRPRQPYIDWANSFEEGAPILTLDNARRAGMAFLIPDFEMEEETSAFIVASSQEIFQAELAAWMDEPERWPENRDFETFLDWFDVEIHSMVFDLGEDPLESLDLGDLPDDLLQRPDA